MLTLRRTTRTINRVLTSEAPDLRFSVVLRLYHGWHRGWEETENLRAIARVQSADVFSDYSTDNIVFSEKVQLRDHDFMRLLGRACRIKSHSFSEDSDYPFQNFTQDWWWPDIRELLRTHGFLEESIRQTSGPQKTLFHIRRAKDLLAAELDLSPPESQDDEIRRFYASLVAKMRESP